jgi:hypothetical protein
MAIEIVNVPIKDGVFHIVINVYQRVIQWDLYWFPVQPQDFMRILRKTSEDCWYVPKV